MGGRRWDDETVLRTLEIVYRISCRRAAWHLAFATLTSRKGPRAQSWKCWKFEPSVLPLRLCVFASLRLCERPTVPAQGIAERAVNWQAELKTSQFARIHTVSSSQPRPPGSSPVCSQDSRELQGHWRSAGEPRLDVLVDLAGAIERFGGLSPDQIQALGIHISGHMA